MREGMEGCVIFFILSPSIPRSLVVRLRLLKNLSEFWWTILSFFISVISEVSILIFIFLWIPSLQLDSPSSLISRGNHYLVISFFYCLSSRFSSIDYDLANLLQLIRSIHNILPHIMNLSYQLVMIVGFIKII